MDITLSSASTTVDAPDRRDVALDGLRGVAVVAVVAYHLGVPGLGGGFVGVDLFFALSGFLITRRLLHEHERTGSVSLRAFWSRRARRLWPLAWLVLAAVAVGGLAGWWGADRQRLLPGETAAGFLHVANWWQAANGGYLQRFASPSPLRHLWSLSIEEQFYVAWPLVLVLALRRGRRTLVAAGLALIAAGAAVGWAVSPGTAYLHTGVRAVAPLAGALAAVALGSAGARRISVARWSAAGIVGLIVLIGVAATTTPEDPFLRHGGFTLVGAAGAAVVLAAVCGGPAWAAALGVRPLVWLGVRSYAIYLVHWPLILLVDPDLDVARRSVLIAGASVVIAAVTFRVVERPVIERRVRGARLAAGGAAIVALGLVALAVAVPDGPTPTERVAGALAEVPDPTATGPTDTGPSAATATPTTACVAAPPPTFDGTTEGFDPSTMEEVADATEGCDGLRVLVVGDSTGRGISNGLRTLGDPRLLVWDRTHFGCSYASATHDDCPPWRSYWPAEAAAIRPDLVIVAAGVVERLDDADDADFLEPSGHERRVATMRAAVDAFAAAGARTVLLTSPAPRRPEGLFFCDRRTRRSPCDPEWVAAWNRSVRTAAEASGATVVDVEGWIAGRGATAADRPDGLHLSATALREQAAWLRPQLGST